MKTSIRVWTTFLLCFGLASITSVEAQPPAKIYRVGYLGMTSPSSAAIYIDAFKEGLRDLGYSEGRNLVIDMRWADGHGERFPSLAAELVALKPDVIVTVPPAAVVAARQAAPTIPIVIIAAADPVGSGFAASLAHPGGNVTGLSGLYLELSGKQLELLHAVVPKTIRFAVLMLDSPVHSAMLKEIQAAAKKIGLTILPTRIKSFEELDKAFASMAKEKAQALIVLSLTLVSLAQHEKIFELAARANLPSISYAREYAEAGGLMSYGPNYLQQFRHSATYVDKILKGARPGDLPIQQPTEFELNVNLKTAKALGITIPQEVLLRADKVIE